MSSFAQLVEKKRKAKQDADKAREAKALRLSQPEVHETDLISGKDATAIADVDLVEPQPELVQQPSPSVAAALPPLADVKRRLRLLKQPATLFGESEEARAARLAKAQEEVQVEDEHIGDRQVFNQLQMEKNSRQDAKADTLKGGQGEGPSVATPQEQPDDGGASEPEDPVARGFARAAAELKEKLQEKNMVVEDKILKYLQRYCAVWEDDLERRSEQAKDSGPGRQATLQFKQTVSYFKALYQQLQQRQCPPEMVAGLWMFIEDIQGRNYLHAYDIYMHLAVGNAPWPIGVTSIGIHDRSAREKIGHTMNAAHIMNDEATRKFLQGMKRLLTFMQRVFPTDPSRAVDFDGFKDVGRGAAGGGSDKLALLQAEQTGSLNLLPAPHRMDTDGSVAVPRKWENMVKGSEAYREKAALARKGG